MSQCGIFGCADGPGVHTQSRDSGRREGWKVSPARRKRLWGIHRAGEADVSINDNENVTENSCFI